MNKKNERHRGEYLAQHGERGYSEKQVAKEQARLIKEHGYAAAPEAQPALHRYLPQLKQQIKDHFSDGRRNVIRLKASSVTKNDASIAPSCPQNRTAHRAVSNERL